MKLSRGLGFKIFLACVAVWASMSAQAGVVVVVPNSLAAAEGNSNNAFPFNIDRFGHASMRYQQVFDSSEFSTLSGPSLLTQIAFRPDSSDGSAFSSLLASIQINFSTTAGSPDALSSTFATNVGSDDMVVFNGPLALSSADIAGPGGTRAFDIIINLTTPFLYDPAAGDLLLDVRNFAGGLTTQFDAHVSGDSVSRVWVGNVGSSTGSPDTLGLVAQFTFESVPEPGTLALLALGLLVVARRRGASA